LRYAYLEIKIFFEKYKYECIIDKIAKDFTENFVLSKSFFKFFVFKGFNKRLKMRYTYLVLVFGLIFTCMSCVNSTDKQYSELIKGRWNIVYSEINNKPSKTLDSAFFEFTADDQAISNVFGGSEPKPYAIQEAKLSIEGLDDPFLMDIKKLNADTLELEGKIKYYAMYFQMIKVK